MRSALLAQQAHIQAQEPQNAQRVLKEISVKLLHQAALSVRQGLGALDRAVCVMPVLRALTARLVLLHA